VTVKNHADGLRGREHERRLRVKTLLFLLLMALLGPSSNVMFRVGMEHVGQFAAHTPLGLLLYGLRTFTSAFVVLGLLTRILFTVVSFLVLTWADYSFVTPASAINYAIVALMGHYLLREAVTPGQWVGIAAICLGVALVGITPTNTTGGKIVAAAGS
jgi:drug/metabolite transporter (DMT)-like permease